MLNKRLSGLILLNTLECLKMALRTLSMHKCKNLRIQRIIELRTNCSIFRPNFNKSIWYHNKLRKTFLRQRFCMVFIKRVTVQIHLALTTCRKCTLPWFVAKLKQTINFLSKAQACNNIKLQDLRALTSSMTITPREARIDTRSLAAAQTFHKKLISTMKWKDRNAFN